LRWGERELEGLKLELEELEFEEFNLGELKVEELEMYKSNCDGGWGK